MRYNVILLGVFMSKLCIVSNGKPATTSRIIAKEFSIEHRTLLRTIRGLTEAIDDKEFTLHNFVQCEFKTLKGVTHQEYVVSEDGAMFLIMGFTGSKATQVKLQFVKAFRAMQEELEKGNHSKDWKATRGQSKIERLSLTDVIKEFVEYATNQGSSSAKMYYMNITKMEYKALELVEKATANLGDDFRSTLSSTELGHLITAESIARGAIAKGMERKLHYKDIYQLAKKEVESFASIVNCYRIKH